jgi:hypothetical protein
MPQKHYYLFKWRIWSIIVDAQEAEEDELEEVEEADGTATTLSSAITLSGDDRPAFGFTPWTPEPWGDYED